MPNSNGKALRNFTPSDMKEVTFITPGGDMMIRLSNNSSQDICGAAEQLKARYFVAQDDWDASANLPVWAVFDLTRCDPNGGGPGRWSLAVPTRTFTTPTADPAVMFAIHLGRA